MNALLPFEASPPASRTHRELNIETLNESNWDTKLGKDMPIMDYVNLF